MEDIYLDKKNTLVNLSNSILRFFDINTFHPSLHPLDEILDKNKDKNIALILLDAFGNNILNQYKEELPLFLKHQLTTIKSIFPTTTVAATNAILLAKFPKETGFLGWSQYFKDRDNKLLDVFPSTDHFSGERIYPLVTETLLKQDNIIDLINKKYNKEAATGIYSFDYPLPNHQYDLDKLFLEANKAIKNHRFTYIYSSEPDNTLHKDGITSLSVLNKIKELYKLIISLINNNKNTVFIIIADHGIKDVLPININDYKDFFDTTIDKYFSIERRFASFKVKDEIKFKELYKKYFKDDFLLLSRQEIEDLNLFGYGNKHNLYDSFLGNYFLLAKTNKYFSDPSLNFIMKANHAGITKEEIEVPLIIFNEEV